MVKISSFLVVTFVGLWCWLNAAICLFIFYNFYYFNFFYFNTLELQIPVLVARY
jgi:hypothetical protein